MAFSEAVRVILESFFSSFGKGLRVVLDKVLSGRYYLTLVCGGTFAYLAVKGLLPPEVTAVIIVLVFEWYFKREDRKNGKDNSPNPG